MTSRTWVCVDEVAHLLARHAAHGVPGALSVRLEEEWSADLAVLRRPLARLRFAIGCQRAAYFIAREQPALAALPAASLPPARSRVPIRVASDDCAFFQGGMISYLMIAALVAGLWCALALGARP